MTFRQPPLAGRLAFVTGSSLGIGRAIALELAEWGADVVVHALGTLDLAEQVAAEIRAKGRRSLALTADIRRKDNDMPIFCLAGKSRFFSALPLPRRILFGFAAK